MEFRKKAAQLRLTPTTHVEFRKVSKTLIRYTYSTVFKPFKVYDIGDEIINLGNSSFSYNCRGFYSACPVSFKLNSFTLFLLLVFNVPPSPPFEKVPEISGDYDVVTTSLKNRVAGEMFIGTKK